jgi:8-oxo-dGTP pyrophosphatase MutT (NUDIX family)
MSLDEQRHRFEVVSSRNAYNGKMIALRVDEVSMPGGRSAVREVVEHPGAVAVAAIDDERRVVMIHQYRHPVGRRLWELPAGLLDISGEDPLATAKRELGEEVGLAAGDWSVLVDVAVSPGFTDESIRVYLATGLSAVDRPGPTGDEEDDLVVRRFPLDEAVRMALAGEVVSASAVAGLLAAHAVLGGTADPRPPAAAWPDRPTAWPAQRSGR